MRTHNSDMFSFKDNEFVVELSTMRGKGVFTPDESFYIKSARTGKKVLFLYEGATADAEGEIGLWTFFNPHVEGVPAMKAVVFND